MKKLIAFCCISLTMLPVVMISIISTGCEGDDDETTIIVYTNTPATSTHHHHNDDSSGNGNGSGENNNGGSNNNGNNPPPSSDHTVRVSNSSTHTVSVTVDGNTQTLSAGSSFTWTYSGSSFDISYDSLGGYDVPDHVTGGKNWSYTIVNSSSVPGTVEMNGSGS